MNPVETRAKILAATKALFGELGVDATTTRDIAERSGVNKGLIHYHFGNKDDLLEALLDDYYQRLTARLVVALAKRNGLQAQAEDMVDAYADFLAENLAFCSIVQREVVSGRHVARLVARTLPPFQLASTWLARGVPAAPARELTHVLTTIYGMIVTYFTYGRVLEQLVGEDPFGPASLASRKAHVRRVIVLLLSDLGVLPEVSLEAGAA
jgi:AcrR family transcriptional regulator